MDLELFTGDCTPLSEAVKIDEQSGTMDIKIIGPGWGSSGYYSKKLLQETAGAYPAGIQNFIDHPTPIQERERPERSLRDLASVQVDNARFEEAGFDGPGLYTRVKVFPEFIQFVKSRAPFIGMSHRAEGKATMGEAEGRRGKIIESISRVHSVDYVTRPGAKGAIGTLYESWKNKTEMAPDPETKTILLESWNEIKDKTKLLESENQGLKEENKTLKESESAKDKEIATLKESNQKYQEQIVLSEAATYAGEILQASNLPELAKTRIKESLIKQATAKDGKLDKDALKILAEAAIKSESEYISGLTGSNPVKNMGGSPAHGQEPTLEEAQKKLVSQYLAMGLTEAQAKIAAGVRV